MRRWLCTAAVVAVTGLGVLLLPARSEAQRGGGGRGGGGRGAAHAGARAGGVHRDFDRGRDFDRRRDFDRAGTRVFIGGGWGWGRPGWGWGPGYYYGGPYLYSPDNSYIYDEAQAEDYGATGQYGAGPTYSTEESYDATQGQPGSAARVTVRLPAPDATIWFNGARMLAQGTNRTFTTPPLEPGQDYHYKIRARFMQNGQPVTESRTLDVRAGQSYTLDFTRGTSATTGAKVPHEGENRNVIREGARDVDANRNRTDADRNRTDVDRSRKDVDRNLRPADTTPDRGPNDVRRPRDTERGPNPQPNDLNRQGTSRPGDGNRHSDTNGQSQPNRNPAGDRDDQERPID